MDNLETTIAKTWCPGCPNFGVLAAVKQAISALEQEKVLERKDLVAVTGIGCHGKMYDHLNLNGFIRSMAALCRQCWGSRLVIPN